MENTGAVSSFKEAMDEPRDLVLETGFQVSMDAMVGEGNGVMSSMAEI